jgi:hypothetical protein
MQGHRTYLDLGRRTTPMDTRRLPDQKKNHRAFSDPIHIKPKELEPSAQQAA